MIEIVFLGTSAMVPTKDRNHSCVFMSYGTEGFLFDCGENAQRQIKIAGIKPTKISRILITHLHGDHVFGLPGLIQTLGMSGYEGKLHLYGPKGFSKFMRGLFDTFAIEQKFEIEVHEVHKGVVAQTGEFGIVAEPLDHGVPCVGYAFIEKDRRRINVPFIKKMKLPDGPLMGKLQSGQEIVYKGQAISPDDATYIVKGKRIAYVVDTRPCEGALALAKDADLLISEATFMSGLEEKGDAYFHMTAEQAASLASQAGAKRLMLTHFSQRYKDVGDISDDAKRIFENVACAYDFLKVKL